MARGFIMNQSQIEMVLKLSDDLKLACEERDKLKADNARLLALARFGRWCLEESRIDFTEVDGGSIQDKAESLGLLANVIVMKPCGEECRCIDYYDEFPAQCLRETDLAQLPVIDGIQSPTPD
jgi:hypothetical protein